MQFKTYFKKLTYTFEDCVDIESLTKLGGTLIASLNQISRGDCNTSKDISTNHIRWLSIAVHH